MSTVRMSDYLIADILGSFKNSYDKANLPLDVETKHGDKIYNTYIGPNIASLLIAIEKSFGNLFEPESMFDKAYSIQAKAPVTTSSVGLSSSDPSKKVIETVLQKDFYFRINLSTERLIPKAFGKHSSYTNTIRFEFDRYKDKDINYICECIEYNSKLEARKQIATDEVKHLLTKFTTLNQAIKAWPALSKLIPSEKLAKVHEKQQRKRKQELQKEMADKIIVSHELNKTILTGALLEDDK